MVQDFYDYKEALKLGQKDYRAKTAKGESPYLPALDEIKTGIAYVVEREEGIIPFIGEAGAVNRERIVVMRVNAGIEYYGIGRNILLSRRRELV